MNKQFLITILFWGMFHSTLLFAQNITQTPKSDNSSPSAKAIWSTLLTGQYSPEILQWHVEQRKKCRVQRPYSLNQQELASLNNSLQPIEAGQPQYKKGWRNFEQESTAVVNNNIPLNQYQPLQATDKNSSEYAQMLRRMEFSLSPKNIPNHSMDQEITQPSNSAVWAKLVMGRSNDELKQWKMDYSQLAYQRSRQNNQQFLNRNDESFPLPSQTDYIAVLIPANSQLVNRSANQFLAENERNNYSLNSSDNPYFNENSSLSLNNLPPQNNPVDSNNSSSIVPVSASVSIDQGQPTTIARPALYIQPVIDSSQREDLSTETVSANSNNDRFLDDGLLNKPQKMKVYRPKETATTTSVPPIARPLSASSPSQKQTASQPDQNGWSHQQKQ